MHQTHAKKDKSKVTGKLPAIGRGHQTRPTGAGRHHDKRTARNRTRSQQNRHALACW